MEINMNIAEDINFYLSSASVVIVDIDNTILRNGIYPIKKMIDYVNELSKENKIYIITGRPESDRDETVKSLINDIILESYLKLWRFEPIEIQIVVFY